MGSLLIYAGVTGNQNEALDQLQRGQVDLVIVEPEDAISTIKNNQQAVFTLYHHEIDPVQVSYINYLGWLYRGRGQPAGAALLCRAGTEGRSQLAHQPARSPSKRVCHAPGRAERR